ncbi:D-alanine---D-serine ligase [Paenibacillus sp. UNC496MF]|uniref:D-alanine--D-alanine ligase family protein n=1 Tax=Paenibacillus sp. UNC496MF TaxID=1502753 RepID=UPI0008E021D7|nr:D-alanine--D-alanine ligase family protein [Paenibacillus sp. UNC496MF]SFI49261.1 D-alanine---D-serine ligase [Paenibacillus sp. UNC496MF]
MMNDKIALGVLFGGASTEYAVSLSSAAAVIRELDRSKYDLTLIGITRDGRWLRYFGGEDDIRDDRWAAHPGCVTAFLSPDRSRKGLFELAGTEYRFTPLDAVFPVLHGRNGEDGTLQGLLELADLPFVGCGSLSSAVCMDKAVAKTLVEAAGVRVPEAATLTAAQWAAGERGGLDRLAYPVYVKPARSGSSIGITKAHGPAELEAGIAEALRHDDKLVVETHVDGVEIGCAVLGGTELFAGALDEIELSGGFFDHDEKYSLRTSSIHLPARIGKAKTDEARETALRVYRALGCSGYARVDLFLAADGALYFNEANTIPGFTPASRYPNMMRAAGLAFPDLLDRLVEEALRGRPAVPARLTAL